jgi:hypothetical protein
MLFARFSFLWKNFLLWRLQVGIGQRNFWAVLCIPWAFISCLRRLARDVKPCVLLQSGTEQWKFLLCLSVTFVTLCSHLTPLGVNSLLSGFFKEPP